MLEYRTPVDRIIVNAPKFAPMGTNRAITVVSGRVKTVVSGQSDRL